MTSWAIEAAVMFKGVRNAEVPPGGRPGSVNHPLGILNCQYDTRISTKISITRRYFDIKKQISSSWKILISSMNV